MVLHESLLQLRSSKQNGLVRNDDNVTPLEYFDYTINDGYATITSYDGPDTEVVVPSTIEGYPVIVGNPTFPSDTVATKVTLSDGVTVQSDGFESCVNLTTIVFQNNVVIENDGVCACSNLNRIEIGSNVSLVDYSLCAQPDFVLIYNANGPGVYTGIDTTWELQD